MLILTLGLVSAGSDWRWLGLKPATVHTCFVSQTRITVTSFISFHIRTVSALASPCTYGTMVHFRPALEPVDVRRGKGGQERAWQLGEGEWEGEISKSEPILGLVGERAQLGRWGGDTTKTILIGIMPQGRGKRASQKRKRTFMGLGSTGLGCQRQRHREQRRERLEGREHQA